MFLILTCYAYNRQPKSPSPFWRFQLLSQLVILLKMAFIKNYENFEQLQNILGNFHCLLYAQHVKIFYIIIPEDHLQKAMTEMLLNLLDEDLDNWDLRQDAMKALEQVLKEAGGFPNEIRDFLMTLDLPPEPPDPKVSINEKEMVT